ncbi:MAG: VRR-NUC domain-containing protein [Gracilimonas sp.]
MMCDCDKKIGLKYLSHQLSEGTELKNQKRIPVSLGFQKNICRECRGLKPEVYPKAEMYGATSKIKRYYWRELHFKQLEIFERLSSRGTVDPILDTSEEVQELYKKAKNKALKEIKKLHKENPKYEYNELTEPEVIEKYNIDVLNFKGTYIKSSKHEKSKVQYKDEPVTVEDYVRLKFREDGYDSLFLESRPLHALFGVFMWILIQDPVDPKNRMVGFGDRNAFEKNGEKVLIHTFLPEDFGTSGYYERRKNAINKHISELEQEQSDLDWLFRYWSQHSYNFRQYLWAHKETDLIRAKELLNVLPTSTILKILRYLVSDYWGNYVGWPDLLAFKDNDFIFLEVKSTGDSLSDVQKNWIKNNYEHLKFPFQLVKVHKHKEIEI